MACFILCDKKTNFMSFVHIIFLNFTKIKLGPVLYIRDDAHYIRMLVICINISDVNLLGLQ